jgi:hypothetical protein
MFEIILNLFTTIVIGMFIFVQIMRADVKSMLSEHNSKQNSFDIQNSTNYKIKSMESNFKKLHMVSSIIITILFIISVIGSVIYYSSK